MHAEDRKAFEQILRELFAAIDKPLGESAIEAFWKGLAKMSLLEFSRCRDLLMDDFSQGEAPRKFGVPDIWAAKKRLRAPLPEPPKDNWQGDEWDRRANMRLFSHVLRAAYARRKLTAEETRTLVAFKNRWADVMRESGTPEEVPASEQNECWLDCVRMAEQVFEQAA